jgi:hypothetical protein
MKTATIHAISAGEAPGYAWTWTCGSDKTRSATAFAYYYDCVTDARKHGYVVELARAHGAMAPEGVGYALLPPRA